MRRRFEHGSLFFGALILVLAAVLLSARGAGGDPCPLTAVSVEWEQRRTAPVLETVEIHVPAELSSSFVASHVLLLDSNTLVVADIENVAAYIVADGEFERITSFGTGAGEVLKITDIQRQPGGFGVVCAAAQKPAILHFATDGSYLGETVLAGCYPSFGFAGGQLAVTHTAESQSLVSLFSGRSDHGAPEVTIGEMLHQKYRIPEEFRDMATPILSCFTADRIYVSHGMISYLSAYDLRGRCRFTLHVDDQVFTQMDFMSQPPRGASLINTDIAVDESGRVFVSKALRLRRAGQPAGSKSGVVDVFDPDTQQYGVLLVDEIGVNALSCWDGHIAVCGNTGGPRILIAELPEPILWLE